MKKTSRSWKRRRVHGEGACMQHRQTSASQPVKEGGRNEVESARAVALLCVREVAKKLECAYMVECATVSAGACV
eukprot:2947547-Pleurochrysis_carterae.AAC.4